jgi:HEAT repeat protein
MIAEHLKKTTDPDVAIRSRAAEDLGDLVEYSEFSEREVAEAADKLIDAAYREQDSDAREAQLNTLAILGSRHVGVKANWQRLTPLLATFDPSSLENALNALGFSRDNKFVGILQSYLTHPKPAIRQSAVDALRELTFVGRGLPG